MATIVLPERGNCPECHFPLIEDSVQGLCPLCLMRTASGQDHTEFAVSQIPFGFSERELRGHTGQQAHSDSAAQVMAVRQFGDYEIHEEIGRGGMGVVYRALQSRLNRVVALKMIRAGGFSTPMEMQRLQREAEALSQLDHPAIVPIFDAGTKDEIAWFSMALVKGKPLSQRLSDGPLSVQDSARLVMQIADGIQHAHERGVIHRDLKPGNILVETDGRQPRITDFGIARRIDVDGTLTSTGEILGTPAWMPPEQAEGQKSGIGAVSDVYSLGAILYACLTGRPPFHAATAIETLRQVVMEAPVRPRVLNRSLPKDLETICLRCLEKSTAQRMPTAAALRDELRRFLDGVPILSRRTSAVDRFVRWSVRHRALSLACMALAGVVIATVIFLLHLQKSYLLAEERLMMTGRMRQIATADSRELTLLMQTFQSEYENREIRDVLQTALADTPESGHLRLRLLDSGWQPDDHELLQMSNLTLTELAAMKPLLAQPFRRIRDRVTPWLDSTIVGVSPRQMLRAVCLLSPEQTVSAEGSSGVVPTVAWPDASEPSFWKVVTGQLLTELFTDPSEFPAAVELLRSCPTSLSASLLEQLGDQSVPMTQTPLVISFLAAHGHRDAGLLAQVACLTDAETRRLVEQPLRNERPAVAREFSKILQTAENSGDRVIRPAKIADQKVLAAELLRAKDAHISRLAMAAGWLFWLGEDDTVWKFLEFNPDSSLRCAVADRIRLTGSGSWRRIWDQVRESAAASQADSPGELRLTPTEDQVGRLRILLQITGELAAQSELSPDDEKSLIAQLVTLFEQHPDAGVHSSAEWALRKLGQADLVGASETSMRTIEIPPNRSWYVPPHGSPMLLIRGPLEFEAGSDWRDPDRLGDEVVDPKTAQPRLTDEEPQHRVRIERDFCVGLREVSLMEFLQFRPDFNETVNLVLSPTLDYPANRINWFLAAEYCNWLSAQQGIPKEEWCFVPDEQGKYVPGMTLAENYLHRRGYRMPTEAEWEYVCRAGTTTRRFFGDCEGLLPQYAWYLGNSKEKILSIPGTLKPNDFGLFDVFGNVLEWTIDPYRGRPQHGTILAVDRERSLAVDAEEWRVLRGCHLYTESHLIRATDLWTFRPISADGHYGLRLARTISSHTSAEQP